MGLMFSLKEACSWTSASLTESCLNLLALSVCTNKARQLSTSDHASRSDFFRTSLECLVPVDHPDKQLLAALDLGRLQTFPVACPETQSAKQDATRRARPSN